LACALSPERTLTPHCCGKVELFYYSLLALVTVKNKFQVVIPRQVRDVIGVSAGDIFEAKASTYAV